MKKITIGIIAHVDSGKTTLSEALLYASGSIRSFGRVDKGDSFLDNDSLERRRGITIFSKQARFTYGDTSFVLIDTPGHVDFSAETERTLQILDYAVLLIGADDGIQAQTKILWKLLDEYQIPTFLFINKMDRDGADKAAVFAQIKDFIVDGAVDFASADAVEQIAYTEEAAMEEYLAADTVSTETVQNLIASRKLFFCLFGSALKQEGITDLLDVLNRYTKEPLYPAAFGAKVYKVARDTDGVRLTYLKITGGSLKTKSLLPDGDKESKINQLRFYSGEKYHLQEVAETGDVCVATGLKDSFAGQGYGAEETAAATFLKPVLNYRVLLESEKDPTEALAMFRQLEEENPELSVLWEEEKRDIYVSVMGQVQLEILKTILRERFALDVSFDAGNVVYQETLTEPIIGVGHFEPLRHYAEVHLLLEPAPRGSGLSFAASVSSDRLAKNWQRLILTHLEERIHRGVLIGAPITDMKITLIAGKAHLKHTEGGDFRQATYRAVRQGLMMTESLLLEPFYRFTLEIPMENIGRALTDLDRRQAVFSAPETDLAKNLAVITGRGAVSALKDYPAEIASYTKGQGSIFFLPDGYDTCRNAEEVIAQKAYDAASDVQHTADSVFCQNGAGHTVPYDEVYDYMHLDFDGSLLREEEPTQKEKTAAFDARTVSKTALGTEEVDAILQAVSNSAARTKRHKNKAKGGFGMADTSAQTQKIGGKTVTVSGIKKEAPARGVFALAEADILLVDGYNLLFATAELSALAKENFDSGRDALISRLSKYRSMVNAQVIAVFDAYRVKERPATFFETEDICLVYTAHEQTADQYIERFVNMANHGLSSGSNPALPASILSVLQKRKGKVNIAVVTSDGTEQVLTRAQGCKIISSREFNSHFDAFSKQLSDTYRIQNL